MGLFVTPEERQRPTVLIEFDKAMATAGMHPINTRDALRDPITQALHLALLPPMEALSRRQQHYAQGLLYKTIEAGLESLTTAEQRVLFSESHSLRELHSWAWHSGPGK